MSFRRKVAVGTLLAQVVLLFLNSYGLAQPINWAVFIVAMLILAVFALPLAVDGD